MVSAIVLGMITNRVVLFDYPDFSKLFESPMNFDIRPHLSSLGNISRHIGPWDYGYFAGSDLLMTYSEDKVLELHDDDYFLFMLQINPFHKTWFQHYFPHGEVFFYISRLVLFPHPSVVDAAAAFAEANFGRFTVGLQIRTRKNLGKTPLPTVDTFISLARSLTRMASSRPDDHVVYVAADQTAVYGAVRDGLPGTKVVWNTENGVGTISTSGGNPGTEFSGFVDLLLLSYCDDMVITIGSSFGQIAAGLSGLRPFHLTTGNHEHRTENPWFWRALSSEPCLYKTGWEGNSLMKNANKTIARLWETSLFGRQQAQCHW